ncbi:hypothetical protein NUU61_002277 [Penicillium alfredii]|uniref:Uncharacterized protein n=1 Tax=Penicillium alfredii TaxID=1506179 RepID=A0A9W9FS02_9EURO|nr:uncharacterized protein NUU61_002277 [Penicillium alfredii]KAJ5104930.1 hypothetical protein NUU61_002277 [Penicillium alfredii]
MFDWLKRLFSSDAQANANTNPTAENSKSQKEYEKAQKRAAKRRSQQVRARERELARRQHGDGKFYIGGSGDAGGQAGM